MIAASMAELWDSGITQLLLASGNIGAAKLDPGAAERLFIVDGSSRWRFLERCFGKLNAESTFVWKLN